MYDARSALTKFNVLTTRPNDNTNGIAYWGTFDDGTAVDWSGNQNNGSFNNTITPIGGIIGNALTFSSTGYVSIPAFPITFPFSISLWVKYTTSSNVVIFECNGNSGFSLQSGAIVAGALSMWCGTGSDGPRANVLSNTGQWVHVVAVASLTLAQNKMYLNGVDSTNTGTTVAATTPTFGQPVYIGSRAGSFGFGASADDVRLYNRIVSGAEANSIYNQAIAFQQGYPEMEMPALYLSSSSFLAAWAINSNILNGNISGPVAS